MDFAPKQGVAHLVGLATDTDYAHELAEALQSKGLDIWIDARLDYGSQWPLERARRKWRFIPRIGLAQSAVVLRPGQ